MLDPYIAAEVCFASRTSANAGSGSRLSMKGRDNRERGFAMLLVFVMAAAVAIMLYRELPRVAFEAQRNKEAMLIERGEQYSRAIQLYVRKWKKYPATMEDLENTNQIRFLRRRYNDPMTGKSEWRIVHVGPGGVFTDSLVHKPPSLTKEEKKEADPLVWVAPTIGTPAAQGQQTGPAFPQTRPSERGGMRLPGQQPGQPVDPSNPQAQQPQTGYAAYGNQPGVYNPNQPQQPGAYPLQQGIPPGVNPQQYPGQPGVNPLQAYSQQPGANPQPTGFNPLLPPGQPQQPGVYPGQPVNSQTGGVSPYPYSTQPGAQGAPPPFGQPGTTATPGGQPAQNQALSLINQILTTPRAGGLAGTGAAAPAGMQIGGGIAGVASTVERAGIKIYNEKEKYNEWEFLYDLTKDKTGMGAALGAAGIQQQQNPQAQQPGQQTQQTPFGQSPFGAQPGFGTPAQPGVNNPAFPAGNSPFGLPPQPAGRR
jgi:hypothetical protein